MYSLLLCLLHFCGNEQEPPGDRLYKLKPIIENLKKHLSDTLALLRKDSCSSRVNLPSNNSFLPKEMELVNNFLNM
jgi:hypothetical protein